MESLHTMVGTPAWVAPEVLQGKPYQSAADVHSFGVVLWELLTGEIPWKGQTPYQILGHVMQVPQDTGHHAPCRPLATHLSWFCLMDMYDMLNNFLRSL